MGTPYVKTANNGKLFVGATEPDARFDDSKNMWLDTANHALKVYDGTSSWATVAVEDGGIATAKLANGVLAASTAGRAKIAANFFDAATIASVIADDALTNAFCDAKFAANAFAADTDSRAIFADGIFTLAKLAATAKTHILSYQVEDLGAGTDIADRVIFEAPSGIDVTLVSAKIIPQGNAAGIDDSNKCVIKLSDGTNTIVEATYDASPAFPAAAAATSLGTLDATYKALAAGEKLYLSVTNGTTANPPAFMLQVVYTMAEAS
jgi:hypothetical protein